MVIHIWNVIDRDGSGVVDAAEFVEERGLRDRLVEKLYEHLN